MNGGGGQGDPFGAGGPFAGMSAVAALLICLPVSFVCLTVYLSV